MSAFIPSHDPPTWWERCLTHPIVIVAAWSVCVAAQVLVDPWVKGFQPSPSLGELPQWTASVLALTLGVGGLAAVVGLLNHWENRSRAWAVERSGWVLMIAGWVAYAVVVLRGFPGSTISWGSALMFAALAVLRITALLFIERRARTVRAEVAAANTGTQEAAHE